MTRTAITKRYKRPKREKQAMRLGRQGPDDVDALDLEQFADRLYAELRLTARHGLADPRTLRGACWDKPRFRLELAGDTHLFDVERDHCSNRKGLDKYGHCPLGSGMETNAALSVCHKGLVAYGSMSS